VIRVCYSNRADPLIGALAQALPAPGDVAAMFQSPWLVIPNRPTELYVDLELARRRGFSGNIDTMSMRGAFARLCADAFPDVVLVDRGHIVGELLAALSDPRLGDNRRLAPIQSYLQAAGGAAEAVDRRRVDIARALGALFDDWQLTRPELMAEWTLGHDAPSLQDTAVSSTPAHGLASAERALWDALFGIDGRFARRGDAETCRYLTLPAVLAARLDEGWRPPPAIHVFGISQISRGLQIALDRLGARTELTLYAINPCREFWEDMPGRRRVRPRGQGASRGSRSAPRSRQLELVGLDGSRDGALTAPDLPSENPFLRLWGHAGRETTRLISELSECDFDSRFVDPTGPSGAGPPSILARLQKDLLDREPERRGERRLHLAADRSIMILGAPNPRRELETVAAEIWAMVRQDVDAAPDTASTRGGTHASLRFSDIAVLVAGSAEPYLPLARAVFREADDLPCTVVNESVAASSHVVEAILALLALPLGTLTRREVLDVITHPNVRARFPEADPRVWLELCDELGIAHGSDRNALAETYIDRDVFNWDQGCKRLALGRFARGPRSGAEDPIVLPGSGRDPLDNSYFPAEGAPDLRPDAESLALLMRSLLADVQFARTARMSLSEWMQYVRAVMAAYVFPMTPDDEAVRLRVFAALDQLASHAPPDLPVALGVAVELVRDALARLEGSRGQILGAGVTVGTLAALRSLPFRVIFVMGMERDRFPGADTVSPLETGGDPRPAADTTQRQRDRYLFIETLLAATDSLVLSYVDRDLLTGEPREPSPVVVEFLSELGQGYLRDRADVEPEDDPTAPADPMAPIVPMAPMVRHVPLHRDEDPRICAAFPSAAAESRARDIGLDIRRDIPQTGRVDAAAIARGLAPPVRQALAPVLQIIEPPAIVQAAARAGLPPRRVLQLSDLRRFLECPLQGSARVFLGLRDLPDDTDARETADEPFDVPRWVERSLLGDVFTAAWSDVAIPDRSRLASCYEAATARPRNGQILPTGLFRDSVRRRHLGILEQWAASLAALDLAPKGPMGRICIGRPKPFAPPADCRDAIRLVVDVRGQGPTHVEIHGLTEPQLDFGPARGSLVLATAHDKDKDRNDKDGLRAFLDHVALSASLPEGRAPRASSGAVCRPSREGPAPRPAPMSFAPLEVAAARAYLAGLAAELLAGVHAYLFPCDAVFFSARSDLTLVERINQIRTDSFLRGRSSSRWGPVPEPFEYPIPDEAEAQKLRERRFNLFFELRLESPVRESRTKT
jgi:exodeoxyribonuclease V gamma subunit